MYTETMDKQTIDQSKEQTMGQPPPRLLAAIVKVLRPLVRLMLSFQITYPMLINVLKRLYVEVAEQEFSVHGKRQSDSRITMLTGVHRKDVKRLREEKQPLTSVPANISVGAQLIAIWTGSDRYCDAGGHPVALPMTSGDNTPSFEELVERVCRKDIRPRVILDEWLRLGVAQVNTDDRISLNTGAFTPEKGFDEKAFFFGKSLHDHISAGTHNLLGKQPPFFDRTVYYDQLSAESVEEISDLARQLGMEALLKVNHRALTLQQRDQGDNANYRMNFGIFHYNDLHDQKVGDGDHA
ncbi:DUF6502 family protein [Pseudohongiella spirulinae]|uniref:Uncharacterized protein n=1 Tax=Pseudohongiella spirulinae TaxID=1249552 RepID=A0A0S2KCM9_9GAMM|nr:DUF6502 family protein [Pseudohongiella spirulinae]ALO46087.1 hypothetical protein PS2015_1430 [Pseudohongiella spirulinae]